MCGFSFVFIENVVQITGRKALSKKAFIFLKDVEKLFQKLPGEL